MTRVLVLGSTGMLGHVVVETLSKVETLTVEGTHRSKPSDLLNLDALAGHAGLRALFNRRGAYDYVINCIGVTKPNIDEQDSESVCSAVAVNALFPHWLAAVTSESGARVIHVSTDGVFSGAADLYLENAPHDALDIYGKTKSLGEASQPHVVNIRCSIVGPDPIGKRGLLEWFLSQPEHENVAGYTEHVWQGVTTLQFAELCREIVVQDCFTEVRSESPVHHYCPNRPVSKYELLKIFGSAFKKNVQVVPVPGPEPPVKRLLGTQYRKLKVLSGQDLSVELAVKRLSEAV